MERENFCYKVNISFFGKNNISATEYSCFSVANIFKEASSVSFYFNKFKKYDNRDDDVTSTELEYEFAEDYYFDEEDDEFDDMSEDF